MPNSDPTHAPAHVYFLGPFRFNSEIEIPELRGSAGPGHRLVTIRLGSVPAALSDATPVGSLCQLTETEYLLNIPETARYYVREGNQVRLEVMPRTPLANVTLYLLGSIFGALCHQNGLLPLHASAVELQGKVVAFLGESGAGKSTLAACLRRRHHRIVADDICLLEPQAAGSPALVLPVAGWLKLWNQSLAFLGEQPVEAHRVYSTDDKFRVFLSADDPAASAPLTLSHVVFLVRAVDPHAQPSLQPVPLLEAVAGLMDLTYLRYVLVHPGQRTRLFEQCARVLRHAQPLRLAVPWDLDRMDAVLNLLDREVFIAGR